MKRSVFWVFGAILLAVASLYGGFLDNPLVFDDVSNFKYWEKASFSWFPAIEPRWLSYYSLRAVMQGGYGVPIHRLISLFLHAGVAGALFLFLHALWGSIGGEQARPLSPVITLLAVLLFAAHPAAVYGAAYLVQRSIVMATLFALLMWWTFLRGLESGRRRWFVASAVLYFLTLSSKEHAITAPAVCVLLLVLHARTHGAQAVFQRHMCATLFAVFVAYALLAGYTALWFAGLLGRAYEPLGESLVSATGLGAAPGGRLYLLSVFNQATYFMKYLMLWGVPNPLWMSIDMREPFVATLWTWPQTGMVAALLAYLGAGLFLLWRGGVRGVVGLGLLAPFALFLTEFSTIRIQEPFVLYRSYFWMAPAFAILLPLQYRDHRKMAAILALVLAGVFAFALHRLYTFSNEFVLWDDAVRLVGRHGDREGRARIFNNRGNAYYRAGMAREAVANYDLALNENSPASRAMLMANRAKAHLLELQFDLALSDASSAIWLNGADSTNFMVRGLIYVQMGRTDKAIVDFQAACGLGWQPGCDFSKALERTGKLPPRS